MQIQSHKAYTNMYQDNIYMILKLLDSVTIYIYVAIMSFLGIEGTILWIEKVSCDRYKNNAEDWIAITIMITTGQDTIMYRSRQLPWHGQNCDVIYPIKSINVAALCYFIPFRILQS